MYGESQGLDSDNYRVTFKRTKQAAFCMSCQHTVCPSQIFSVNPTLISTSGSIKTENKLLDPFEYHTPVLNNMIYAVLPSSSCPVDTVLMCTNLDTCTIRNMRYLQKCSGVIGSD
ncbi:hypothetical protein AMECASPLE_035738 [Ameca splendens]|uniref:Uncharacterized protein n=1 Tax=Ameca splendens TaxID=208324 RepID=A0ABV0YIV5_9TELE